jgi:putative ABC transport system substrate-binding protein
VAKRLGLLHELVPKAVHVAVLVNPANATNADSTSRDVQEAARALGLQIQILRATTIGEIDVAFATLARDRPDALFVAPDGFFVSRHVQFATLAARDKLPTAHSTRAFVEAGGLMSYGSNLDIFHQVGIYTGRVLTPTNCAPMKGPRTRGRKFQRRCRKALASVTAGLAKDLEAVNSRPT